MSTWYTLSKMEEMSICSAIIFISMGRLAALHRFKSGQVPFLFATDVANCGLDIPTVDIVINYDIPRDSRDYVHRVQHSARAGRGGLAMSFNDVELIHKIEAVIGKQLERFECKENEVLSDIMKVYKARRVSKMKMMDDGFEDIVKERKKQKLRTVAEKGLLKNRRK